MHLFQHAFLITLGIGSGLIATYLLTRIVCGLEELGTKLAALYLER